MKLSNVAAELRGQVRWMPAAPIGNRWGLWLTRMFVSRMKSEVPSGVAVSMSDAGATSVRIYVPDRRLSEGALLWIHGGGYVVGTAAMDDRLCGETSRDLGIVVVSVDYRLAPEHPFPAPADDCFEAWSWLQHAAPSLGIDPLNVAVGGQSAGGGLAAALVQRIHDAGGIKAKAQWLFCPMLDDRTAARHELDPINHFVWSNLSNSIGWSAYLGTEPGGVDSPPYAAAGRRCDLDGLPKAWIGTGDIDLFCDENRTYAARLRDAAVDATLEIVPGAPHGFEAWARDTALADKYLVSATQWLGRILNSPS